MNTENGLFARGSEVQDTVVQAGLHMDVDLPIVFLFLGVFGLVERGFVDLLTGIRDLERQERLRTVDHEDGLDLEFQFLRAGLDRHFRLSHQSLDVHDTLIRNMLNEFDHLFRDSFILERHALDSVEGVTQDHEGQSALDTGVVHTRADGDRLTLERVIDILD